MSWCTYQARVPILVGIFVLACAGWSLAGGPISLFESGRPNLWGGGNFATFPIPYLKDQGPLGPLSNDEADALTTFSMNEWDQIPTSTFSVIDGGDTPVDITATNAASYLFSFHGAVIDVVYDHDGSICTAVFGCPPGVLGLGGPVFLGTTSPEIASAVVLMNGAAINPSDTGGAAFRVVFSQESGHAIGLHHDQTNGAISFFGDESAPTGCPTMGTPTPSDFTAMYPFANISPFGPGAEAASIDHLEDIHALSRFHPVANYRSTTGTITGTVFQSDGVTPVNGINVIARSLTAPFTDARSTITGDLSFASGDGFEGTFILTGLTPGSNYTLAIDNIVDGAFPQPPAPPFTEEYWNGTSETGSSITDNPCELTIITAMAGSTFTANFLLNTSDTTNPTVTINQAADQLDPTSVSPVNFTVVFSEPVNNFSTGDVTLGGTANATISTVSEILPHNGTTYNVAVSGMTSNGTVIATIPANVAIDGSGNGNTPSTSNDNEVTFSVGSPPQPLVSNLTVASGLTYQIVDQGLQTGTLVYVDRNYIYQTVPPVIQGATYILTANNDKSSQGPNFLTFDVNQPVTVFIGHDQRIQTKPSWLASFTLTGENFASSDTTFDLYRQDFPAGTVTLGGNEGTGKSMYSIAVLPSGQTPPPPKFGLTVTMGGNGGGRVTSNTGSIDCPSISCTASFLENTIVTLTAQPDPGSLFLGWSGGGCHGTGICQITMTQAQNVTATFSLTHLLTIQLTGTGGGTVTSDLGAITCPPICSDLYPHNTTVTLTAVSTANSVFDGWNGGGCSGTQTCQITMTQASTVFASFSLIPPDTTPPQVSITTPGNGQNVSGTILVSATAADPSGVAGVQFILDDVAFGAEDAIEPYEVSWDSSQSTPGTHRWKARARDTLGNIGDSTEITVNVIGTPPPLSITNLTAGSGRTYQIGDQSLQTGALVYVDRIYVYQTVPAVIHGATYILTANNDKSSQGPNFLTFDVNQPVTVFIGHDQRIQTKPAWLASFTLTGENFASSDTTFDLYRQDFPAGTITLGGNEGAGKSMYGVILVPATLP